jgi:membrane protease YdiL (CAAX protease family)
MDATPYFLRPDGQLRAGWRLLLFLLAFFAAAFIFRMAAGLFLRAQPVFSQIELLTLSTIAGLASLCLATWVMTSRVDHQPFQSIGLNFQTRSPRELVVGLSGGAGLVGVIAFIEWTAGGIHFQRATGYHDSIGFFVVCTGLLVLSASNEELLFRGYPFQRLIEGTGEYAALGVASALFGFFHLANPHSTRLAVINTILAGLLIALLFLKTRSLWMPIAFHFSWNWSLAVLGLPISGIQLIRMPWQVVPSIGKAWLHGSDYGPEGGAAATVLLGIAIVFVFASCEKHHAATKNDGLPPGALPFSGSKSS